MIPRWDSEDYRKLFFDLSYIAHGGSGLNVDLLSVHAMDLGDIIANVQLLDERRREEAAQISAAYKKSSK